MKNEERNLDDIDMAALGEAPVDPWLELGQHEYFIAKRAAIKMREFLRIKKEERKKQEEMDKEDTIKM